jgi:diguanylate cyclase (GGDEF)-like protein
MDLMGQVPDRLHLLARATRTASDLGDLFGVAVMFIEAELSADGVYVGRIDHRHGRIDIVKKSGTFEELDVWNGAESFPVSDQARAQVVSESAELWTATIDESDLLPYDKNLLDKLGQGSAASFPIIMSDIVWGVLYITRKSEDPFDEPSLMLGALVSEFLAAGIARVDYHRQLHRLAYTDPLTEMANRRAVDEQLLAWASDPETAPRLTVVLCDVNRLKFVNDKHGHPTGDRLLREVGMLVSTSASRFPRALAGRIGGDEFVLAIPDVAPHDVEEEMGRLLQAAATLPYGDGLSCGVASCVELTRLELEPADQVRALLRLADAEQYRHKMADRNATALPTRARVPGSRRTAADFRELADSVAVLIQGIFSEPGDVGQRLSRVAATVCESSNGAAWWVSEIEHDVIVDRYCGTPRDEETRDGQWQPTTLDPKGYRLSDFPESARAIEGASFVVDALHGDDAERRFLIQTGFRAGISAGGKASDGTPWLVEVFGDALTPELHHAQALLLALTTFALQLPDKS